MGQNLLTYAKVSANRSLRRLFVLRNIAIIGQLVVIGVAVSFLDISLPIVPL